MIGRVALDNRRQQVGTNLEDGPLIGPRIRGASIARAVAIEFAIKGLGDAFSECAVAKPCIPRLVRTAVVPPTAPRARHVSNTVH
jgi:hypothetical protein